MLRESGRARRLNPRNVVHVALLAGALVVPLAVYARWEERINPLVSGDEPHYLVMAQSLVRDRDLDLTNNYAADIQQLFPGLAPANAVDMRDNGRLRPIQGPAMGVVLAPAVVIGDGAPDEARWARRWMVLLAAVLAQQVLALMLDLRPRPRWLAVAVWVPFALCLPLVMFANQLYPEIPGALIAVVALRLGRRATSDRGAALAGTVAAALPWITFRFAPIAIGLALWIGWRRPAPTARERARVALPALIPVGVSLVLLAAWYFYAFGTVSLTAVWDAAGVDNGWSPYLAYQRGGGMWLSPIAGLLPLAPFYLVGLLGLGVLWRRSKPAAVILAGAGLLYVSYFAASGYRGVALPARMIVIATPLLVLTALFVIHERRWLLVPYAVLVAFAFVVVRDSGHYPTYGDLYAEDGVAIPAVRRVASYWPNFTDATGADEVAAPDPLSRGAEWGPVELRKGEYRVTVLTRCPAECTVDAEVWRRKDRFASPQRVGRHDTATWIEDIPNSGSIYDVRVSVPGDVEVTGVTYVLASEPESRHQPVLDDIPLTIAWVAAIGAAAVFVALRPGRTTAPDSPPCSNPAS